MMDKVFLITAFGRFFISLFFMLRKIVFYSADG